MLIWNEYMCEKLIFDELGREVKTIIYDSYEPLIELAKEKDKANRYVLDSIQYEWLKNRNDSETILFRWLKNLMSYSKTWNPIEITERKYSTNGEVSYISVTDANGIYYSYALSEEDSPVGKYRISNEFIRGKLLGSYRRTYNHAGELVESSYTSENLNVLYQQDGAISIGARVSEDEFLSESNDSIFVYACVDEQMDYFGNLYSFKSVNLLNNTEYMHCDLNSNTSQIISIYFTNEFNDVITSIERGYAAVNISHLYETTRKHFIQMVPNYDKQVIETGFMYYPELGALWYLDDELKTRVNGQTGELAKLHLAKTENDVTNVMIVGIDETWGIISQNGIATENNQYIKEVWDYRYANNNEGKHPKIINLSGKYIILLPY
jgi:hypothetical protein